MSRSYSVREIAAHVGGEVVGDPEKRIAGVSSIQAARPDQLVFIDNPRYAAELRESKAGAAIVPDGFDPSAQTVGIRVRQPALAMARAIELLVPFERTFRGVSSLAVVDPGVELGPDVGIGPYAHIGEGARIGRGTEIHAGVTVGRRTVVGEDCVIYPGAHVYHDVHLGNRVILHSGCVIGADGFGFVQEKVTGPDATPAEPLRHHKMRQVGTVVLEDDVEIGANSTIDRAALDETRIGRGTKIDNLVMIGHNCRVGRHSILVAQSGLSGSTLTGDYVTIAGQAGIAGHLRIGSRVVIGAQSGVTKDIPDGQIVFGSPAIDARQARKAYTLIDSLPEMKRSLAAHEKRLAQLEGKPAPEAAGSGEVSGT
jgi:UDP-3-O-[3-hydroxymyristoyl] glucosamine N-acyltransferase